MQELSYTLSVDTSAVERASERATCCAKELTIALRDLQAEIDAFVKNPNTTMEPRNDEAP